MRPGGGAWAGRGRGREPEGWKGKLVVVRVGVRGGAENPDPRPSRAGRGWGKGGRKGGHMGLGISGSLGLAEAPSCETKAGLRGGSGRGKALG